MSETQTPVDEGFMREFKEMQRKLADIGNASVGGASFATGDLIPSAAAIRTGALLCDGSSYLDADYPDLGALLRSAGLFSDATHFTTPDYTRRALVGVGGGWAVGVEVGGAETVTLTAIQSGLPAHAHPAPTITVGNESAHTHGPAGGGTGFLVSGLATFNWSTGAGLSAGSPATTGAGSSHTHTGTSSAIAANSAAPAASAHTNLQPSVPAYIHIKT